MPFDQEKFRRDFLESCDIADGIRSPTEVRATVTRQAGRECLRGVCPKCRTVAHLWDEGKHLCRGKGCGAWLKYRRA